MSIWLEREDVIRLTGRKRFGAQRRALDRMAISYELTADGEPLVRLGYRDAPEPHKRRREPRWHMIGEPRKPRT